LKLKDLKPEPFVEAPTYVFFEKRIPDGYPTDGTYAIKGGHADFEKSHSYCADDGAKGIICDRKDKGPWEKFELRHLGGLMFALKGGKEGKWCADKGSERVVCQSDSIEASETFEFKLAAGNKLDVVGGESHKYCADEGRKRVNCNRGELSSKDKFEFERQ
jgi:hypothetical protein